MCTKNLIPNSFDKGYIKIGVYKDDFREKNVYFNPKNSNDTGLVIIGKMGSGKNTYPSHYFTDVCNSKDSFVHIDYLDDSVSIDSDNVIIIDLNKDCDLIKLNFNEIVLKEDSENREYNLIKTLKYKSELLFNLLNSVSSEIEISCLQKNIFIVHLLYV